MVGLTAGEISDNLSVLSVGGSFYERNGGVKVTVAISYSGGAALTSFEEESRVGTSSKCARSSRIDYWEIFVAASLLLSRAYCLPSDTDNRALLWMIAPS